MLYSYIMSNNVKITHPDKVNIPDLKSASEIKFGTEYANHMFLSEYEDGKWNNPRIVPFGNLSLSPGISALHYGQAVFEGLKVVKKNGKIFLFRIKDNCKRLNKSLERMSMPTIPEDLFVEAFEEYVRSERDFIPEIDGVSLYLRPFVFASDSNLGLKPSTRYTWCIISFLASSYYTKPLRLKIEEAYTRAAKGGVGSAKTAGNYAASMQPTTIAQNEGYDQVVWTDSTEHRYIEESGGMNIAFIVDGKMITPKLTDSILPGITRDSFIVLAKEDGITVEERSVSVEEICDGIKNGSVTEAFGMGTAVGLSFIESITYRGVEYKIPVIENRKADALAQKLINIKQGDVRDTKSWIKVL